MVMDDEPRPEHDDGRCINSDCGREALLEGGIRIAYCQTHLEQYSKVSMSFYSPEELRERPNVVASSRLSLRERAWLPQDFMEQAREWPTSSKIEAFGDCFVHQLDGGWYSDDAWTWRSVAMAMRAFPDREIRLVGSTIYIPQSPAEKLG